MEWGQADLLHRFEIDDTSNFVGRLFNGKVCWIRTFEYLVDVVGRPAVQVGQADAVRHKPAGLNIFSITVDRREPVLLREFRKFCSVRIEDWTATSIRTASDRSLPADRNAVSMSLESSTSIY